MAVTLVTTPGAADASSYVSVADADTYFNSRLRIAAWTNASTDDKGRALIMATADLEANVEWDIAKTGWRTHRDGALKFPKVSVVTRSGDAYYDRESIPPFVVEYVCEQALAHLVGERTTDVDARGIEAVTVGPVSVDFDTAVAGARKLSTDRAWRAVSYWAASSGDVSAGTLRTADLVRV